MWMDFDVSKGVFLLPLFRELFMGMRMVGQSTAFADEQQEEYFQDVMPLAEEYGIEIVFLKREEIIEKGIMRIQDGNSVLDAIKEQSLKNLSELKESFTRWEKIPEVEPYIQNIRKMFRQKY